MRSVMLAESCPEDSLAMETLISQRIAARDAQGGMKPLAFHCTLSPVAKDDGVGAELRLEPQLPVAKEFSVFATYFRSFIAKLVPRNLVPSATV